MTNQANGDETRQANGGQTKQADGDGGWSNLGIVARVTIVGVIGTLLLGIATFILDIADRFDGTRGTTPVALAPEPEPTSTATPVPAIEIVRVNYAPTTDQSNEYVELRNNGSEALPLLGWRLEDSDNHSFDKFGDFTLLPGASIKVWTCRGENGPSDLFWGRNSPVWNNDRSDTATLRDDLGVIVATRTYEP